MQSLLPYLLMIHSAIRYVILLLALIVSIQSLMGMMTKKTFNGGNRIAALILLIFCDLQLVFGLWLYFVKGWPQAFGSGNVMADPYKRFWAVEHSVSMLIAIILVHVGYSITKKQIDSERKFKRLFWCAFIALAIFMAMTPWASKMVVGRPNVPQLHS
jgi:membrane protease YdiL (CAAX protease family)